jgi:hypothetical protein
MFSYREGVVKRGIKEVREERRTKFLSQLITGKDLASNL